MAILFALTIDGSPVFQQTRSRELLRQWTQEVRNVVGSAWGSEPPVVDEVMVTIIYFYDNSSMDVDNIPKPILDVLKSLVFHDDIQITDLLCRKRVLT